MGDARRNTKAETLEWGDGVGRRWWGEIWGWVGGGGKIWGRLRGQKGGVKFPCPLPHPNTKGLLFPFFFPSHCLVFPVFGDVEVPLPGQVVVLVVVSELGLDGVSATGD